MSECVNKKKNQISCTCSYPCSTKGICCECLHTHLRNKELPGCCFPPSVEKTYDRSFKRFVETYKDLLD